MADAPAPVAKAAGFLTKLAGQLFHPKNWVRNAGVIALGYIFLPAVATMASGTATSSFLGTAWANAWELTSTVVTSVPDVLSAGAHGISELSGMIPTAA
ncbi:MAG: hypothetical protein LRZ85_09715 [Alphaproteobacteria bacterium]|nr:hypothetical protein [Alphaproteobacteria bacterium]MCD8570294.1 hypothetical protein [Alphaproteobacteria bacterium]